MTHSMKLHQGPFALMAAGKKTVELRLNDEKRRRISVGDTIVFTGTGGMTLSVQVKALHRYPSFRELYADFTPEQLGYLPGEAADSADMNAYYSPEKQNTWGVLAIEVALLPPCEGTAKEI